MVGRYFQRCKQCRHHQSPQVFPAIGQHEARNHRGQIGQCYHLPDMPCGNDDEEIARERPDDTAEHGQIPAEVEGTQQDIESQQVGKHIPHVLRQPQVVGLLRLLQQLRTLVRRRYLVRRHTTEQRVRPSRPLTGALVVFRCLLSCAPAGRRVVPVEDASLDVGREEIGERYYCKKNHCHDVWQPLFEIFHNAFSIFCVQSYEKLSAKQKNLFFFLPKRSNFATFCRKVTKKFVTLHTKSKKI